MPELKGVDHLSIKALFGDTPPQELIELDKKKKSSSKGAGEEQKGPNTTNLPPQGVVFFY